MALRLPLYWDCPLCMHLHLPSEGRSSRCNVGIRAGSLACPADRQKRASSVLAAPATGPVCEYIRQSDSADQRLSTLSRCPCHDSLPPALRPDVPWRDYQPSGSIYFKQQLPEQSTSCALPPLPRRSRTDNGNMCTHARWQGHLRADFIIPILRAEQSTNRAINPKYSYSAAPINSAVSPSAKQIVLRPITRCVSR